MASSTAPDATSPFSYPPSETALLLLDYHNAFVGSLEPEAKQQAVISSATQALKWARSNNILVLHCLIDTADSPPASSLLSGRWSQYQQMFTSNPSLAEESPSLRGEDKDELNMKRQPGRVSALKSPGVMESLSERGIKSLAMCGLVSSGCTLSTARAATDEGFVSTVLEDGCADRDDDTHDTMMAKVLKMVSHVMKVGEWVEGMEKTAKA